MKSILFVLSIAFLSFSFSQSSGSVKTVEIQTSAECGMCKTRIEDKLNYTAGIKFAELDLETKKVLIKYNSKKITVAEIKTIISETGYAADEVKAVPEAVEKLPACCKPGGMKK